VLHYPHGFHHFADIVPDRLEYLVVIVCISRQAVEVLRDPGLVPFGGTLARGHRLVELVRAIRQVACGFRFVFLESGFARSGSAGLLFQIILCQLRVELLRFGRADQSFLERGRDFLLLLEEFLKRRFYGFAQLGDSEFAEPAFPFGFLFVSLLPELVGVGLGGLRPEFLGLGGLQSVGFLRFLDLVQRVGVLLEGGPVLLFFGV